MLQTNHFRLIFNQASLLIVILLWSCANPVAPTGGPKDVTPPEVVIHEPENRSLNFNKDQIQLTFNEYVQLKNTKDQVIISPPFQEDPEFKIKGKSVTIHFKDTLRENTTYTIFLGKAISDITENNPLLDYRYVFSTGTYLDSSSLVGRVVNAFTLRPEVNVHVMLYDTPGDSVPYLERPYYVSRTDSSGVFHFYHLRDLQYLLFALKETNGNYLYDDPNELIAFVDTLVKPYYIPEAATVDLTDSVAVPQVAPPDLILDLFQETDSSQRLLENKVLPEGIVRLAFRMPLRAPSLRVLDTLLTQPWYMPEWNEKGDTLLMWLYREPPDTIYMELADETRIIDTLRILTHTLMQGLNLKKFSAGEKLTLSSNLRAGKLDPFSPLTLLFSHPVLHGDLSALRLIAGRDTLIPESSFSDSLHRRLTIHNPREADSSYQLLIPDSTFFSIRGTSHDTIRMTFMDRALEEYGTLTVNLMMPDTAGQYLLQVIKGEEEVVEQRNVKGKASERIEFPYLTPGRYRVKVIFDKNHNDQWDPGRYILKRAPEKVRYYEKTLEIRANWISEETWEL